MRKIGIGFMFIFLLAQAGAQIKMVKQLKDIKKDSIYYVALKNLVERYGVIGTEETRQGNNYFPANPLNHRAFAIVMVTALDRLHEKFNRLAFKMEENTRDSLFRLFTKKHFKGYADSAVKHLTGYAQYKDINNDDIDHACIKKLTNFYRLKLGDTENTFSPDKPMTEKELGKIFIDYFGERSVVTRATSANATRGKWAIYLDALLERLNESVIDLASFQ